MRRWVRWTVAALMIAGVAGGRPARAQTAEAWVMLPFTSTGIDATAAQTFAGLLKAELANTAGAYFITTPARACTDGTCAVAAARTTGARYVVWGDMVALGKKVIVTVSTADAARNAILCVQRISAARLEELDVVVFQIAKAVAQRRSVDTVSQPRPAPAAPAPAAPAPAPPTPRTPAYPPPAPPTTYPPAGGPYPPPAGGPYPPGGSPSPPPAGGAYPRAPRPPP
ncbi:MAG: hypothetical protein HY906_05585, partial [Deltaproteobacteria bacterium]|nr:hypothetical protein [Deltaproteobacteria bacterium]